MSILSDLRARAGVRPLLSSENSNPKVAKNAKVGHLTAVLHLAPGNMSGHEVCPKRSPGCSAACLHFAGNPLHQDAKTKARIARTKALFADRNVFMNLLALEIDSHIRKAEKKGQKPSFRLNGTSDIVWEKKSFILFPEVAAKLKEANKIATNVIAMFPTAQFYDYTAIPRRTPPSNYHLTFSMKENNMVDVVAALNSGFNIAVVFPTATLPQEFDIEGSVLRVVDGDEHDYRPLDPSPCVIGLKAKGAPGKQDTSGFVHRNMLSNTRLPVWMRGAGHNVRNHPRMVPHSHDWSLEKWAPNSDRPATSAMVQISSAPHKFAKAS